jgi:hypothetical protein
MRPSIRIPIRTQDLAIRQHSAGASWEPLPVARGFPGGCDRRGSLERGPRRARVAPHPPLGAGRMALTLAWWPSQIMQTRLRQARRRDVWACVLLAALLFRAYIPVGFMPASGSPFLVELCPAYGSAPAHHAHHHHSSQGRADFQDCPFGSAPAPGPVSDLIGFEPPGLIASPANIPAEPARARTRPLHAYQSRGPPSLA